MKKKVYIMLAALAISGASLFSSCSKSTDDLLNNYDEIGKEAAEAIKNKDLTKLVTLGEKAAKIEKELNGRTLSAQEKAKFDSLTIEIGKMFQESDK